MPDAPLAGISVLDLTDGIAGPFCTKLLADYGADVLKVERPRLGDWTRHRGPFAGDRPGPERSLLFAYLNTNKRSLTLDLDSEFGRATVRRLASQADLLVESAQPGYLEARGLAQDTLRAENKRLVVTSISLFDRRGPHAQWKATEINLFAMSALMSTVGGLGRPPIKAGGYQAQYMAGLQACAFTMFAMFKARTTGEGCWVDTSVMQTCGKILEHVREQQGKSKGDVERDAHNGVMACKEGYVTVTLYYHMLPELAALINQPSLANDPTLIGGAAIADRGRVRGMLSGWLQSVTADEAQTKAQQARVLITKVNTTRDAVESPHFQARGSFIEVNHPVIGTAKYSGPPFHLLGSPPPHPQGAPALGEANEDVLCGRLGHPREALSRLWAAGAI